MYIKTSDSYSRRSITVTWKVPITADSCAADSPRMPVPRNRNYEYEYEEAPDARSAEYLFVKYFNALMLAIFLLSSIWIFIFIFDQADWQRNALEEDIRAYTGVTTWTWWTVVIVGLADLVTIPFLWFAVWHDKSPYLLILLAILSYTFSLYGIVSVYLRGSIVCFVFPFVIATLSIIQFLMQRTENEEFEITRGLRLREKEPTMEQFLRD